MRCEDAFEALSAACDGALAAHERRALDQHVGGCAACQNTKVALLALNRRLRGSAHEQAAPSPVLVKRITALVSPAPTPRRFPFTFGFALVGATSALAALAFVARAQSPDKGESPFTQSTSTSPPVAAIATPAASALGRAQTGAPCQFVIGKPETGSPVGRACASGGFDAAKRAMQQLVARAQARGSKITCGTCHRDERRFELRDDARVRLQDLLGLVPT